MNQPALFSETVAPAINSITSSRSPTSVDSTGKPGVPRQSDLYSQITWNRMPTPRDFQASHRYRKPTPALLHPQPPTGRRGIPIRTFPPDGSSTPSYSIPKNFFLTPHQFGDLKKSLCRFFAKIPEYSKINEYSKKLNEILKLSVISEN